MRAVSYADTEVRDIQTPDYRSVVRPYYGKVAELCEGPQTFLVDMPDEGSTIKPHFHDVDQYQVIVRGGGRLGKEKAEPVVFHYADAYTPYGPIIGGKEGVAFYTVRAACAGGYFGMPGSRHLMPGKPGRNIAGKFEINQPLPAQGAATRESLMHTDDGVDVVGLRMGPNAQAEGHPVTAGAQYYLVGTGSLLQDGRELPPLSMLLVEPGEQTPSLKAGPKGAEVLIMQLPRGSERPGSQVRTLAERGLNDFKMPEGMLID